MGETNARPTVDATAQPSDGASSSRAGTTGDGEREALHTRLQELLATGSWEAARAAAEALVAQCPDDARAWAACGRARSHAGAALDETIDALETAISLDDTQWTVALWLAELYLCRGDDEQARSLLLWLGTAATDSSVVRRAHTMLQQASGR